MVDLELDAWLKGEDVDPEAELTFVDGGEAGSIPGKDGNADTPTFEIGVKFKDGQKRKWTMNMTSQRAVATSYGTKTDAWIGKKVVAFTTAQNVRGTIKKVIYARVPVTPPAA